MTTYQAAVYTAATAERTQDMDRYVLDSSAVTGVDVVFYLAPNEIPWWNKAKPWVHKVALMIDGNEVYWEDVQPIPYLTGIQDFTATISFPRWIFEKS